MLKRFTALAATFAILCTPTPRAHAFAALGTYTLPPGSASFTYTVGDATRFYCLDGGGIGKFDSPLAGYTLYTINNGTTDTWYLGLSEASLDDEATAYVNCGLWSDFHGNIPERNFQDGAPAFIDDPSKPPFGMQGGQLWNLADSFCSSRGIGGNTWPEQNLTFTQVGAAPPLTHWTWFISPNTHGPLELFTGCFSFSSSIDLARLSFFGPITIRHGSSGGACANGGVPYDCLSLPDRTQWACAVTARRGSLAGVNVTVDEDQGELYMSRGANDPNDSVSVTCVNFLVQ